MHAMVLAVPMTMQVPTDGASRPLTASISTSSIVAGAVLAPQPPAIGAGAQHLALVMADHHRPDRNDDGRQVGADRAP